MAKTVLGKGLKALLKKSPEVTESTPEMLPFARNETPAVTPGVGALLRGRPDNQAAMASGQQARPGWLAYWPWIRALLWGSDVLLVCLGATALLLATKRPSVLLIVLSALGFAAGAGLASLAVVAQRVASNYEKHLEPAEDLPRSLL